jgi:hypothetical protein
VGNIKYIDSTGLGTLAVHLSAKTQVPLCASVSWAKINEPRTKLLTVFDVTHTQAAAVGSFQAAKATAA